MGFAYGNGANEMNNMILDFLKHFLTLLGARLSNRVLLQIQTAINYLRLGHWMSDHKFSMNHRKRGREGV